MKINVNYNYAYMIMPAIYQNHFSPKKVQNLKVENESFHNVMIKKIESKANAGFDRRV